MSTVLPLTAEQLQLVGEVAVTFGGIEGTAALMAALLIEPDIETGVLVGAGDQLSGHLARLKRLARYRLDKLLANEIEEWCKKVEIEMAPERNVILHGAWVEGDAPGELYKAVRRRPGALKHEAFTTDRLLAARDRAFELWEQGAELARKIDMAPKWAVWLRDRGRPRPRWENGEPEGSEST